MTSRRSPSVESILTALAAVRIAGPNERAVQDGIDDVLTNAGFDVEREAVLGPRDRIDFLVGSVGIEVKTQGSRGDIIRQLGRYAKHERITALILASSLRRILHTAPSEVLGVPVHPHLLQGGLRA